MLSEIQTRLGGISQDLMGVCQLSENLSHLAAGHSTRTTSQVPLRTGVGDP